MTFFVLENCIDVAVYFRSQLSDNLLTWMTKNIFSWSISNRLLLVCFCIILVFSCKFYRPSEVHSFCLFSPVSPFAVKSVFPICSFLSNQFFAVVRNFGVDLNFNFWKSNSLCLSTLAKFQPERFERSYAKSSVKASNCGELQCQIRKRCNEGKNAVLKDLKQEAQSHCDVFQYWCAKKSIEPTIVVFRITGLSTCQIKK